MKKLLLTSAGFENPRIGQEFLKLIDNKPEAAKVLFIPTASRTEEELFYVNKSREELLQVGIKEKNIITYNLDNDLSETLLADITVVYVCGGNSFYLLHRVREANFDKVLDKLINKGVIYVGASAGSLLMSPFIKIGDKFDFNDIGITDFTGLGYTKNIIIPHYTRDAYEEVQKIKEKSPYPVIILTDAQALLVIDDRETILFS